MLVENSLDGYFKLEEWIRSILQQLPEAFSTPYFEGQKKIPFIAESTGPYSQTFLRIMDGIESLFMPYMINAMMQDRKNRKANMKTDKRDAIDLAKKGRTGSLVGFHPYKFMPSEVESIRTMARYRSRLVKERTAWYQRLSSTLIFNGVTLTTSYERDKVGKGKKGVDSPFTERAGFWHSRGGVNLLHDLKGLNGEVTKSDLHDLGEYAGLSPTQSEIHLNGFLNIPYVVLENVIFPTLLHTKKLDKDIDHLEDQIDHLFETYYPREREITLSCPSLSTVGGAVIFGESGPAEYLSQKFKHVDQYLRYSQLGLGKQITGGKLIGVETPPGNKRLGYIYRIAAKSVMRNKSPEFNELQTWALSLQRRTNYLKASAGLARRICRKWYFAITKDELCSLDKYEFHAVRKTREKEIVKVTDLMKGINLEEKLTLEEAMQLGNLVDAIGKSIGQTTVYMLNPDFKEALSSTQVEEVFKDDKSGKSIAYHLKRGGVHTLDILIGKVVTDTLLLIPQIGKVNKEKIITRLLKNQYIFDITDKSYQEKRYTTQYDNVPLGKSPEVVPSESEVPY